MAAKAVPDYDSIMNDHQIWSTLAAGDRRQLKPDLSRRILVVDDEPLIRQLYTEVLVEAGHTVDGAENGLVAWDALQVSDYDLLITDNVMPKSSGVDLLKKIHVARMTLPVMMATATFPEEVFIRYPELQPAVTLLKPHTVTEFLEAVEEVLCIHDGVSEELAPLPVIQASPSVKHLWLR
jgi:DNA-binding response OmpR family regulator